MRGYRGFPRPKPEGREKTSKRIAIKFKCQKCGNTHQPPNKRSKKLDIGE